MSDEGQTNTASPTDGKRIIAYKKCLVIEKGVITRMFWEHPTANDEFTPEQVARVFEAWYKENPDADYTDARWLSDHGFYHHNVIRDGVRPQQ